MTDSPDYRKYLEERFNGLNTSLNANFITVHDKFDDISKTLEKIEDHTAKTNGRVSNIENWRVHVDEVIKSRGEKSEEIVERIEAVEKKMENLEEKLSDAFFFIRHPKLFVGILVVVVLLTLATFITNNPLKVFDNIPNTEISK